MKIAVPQENGQVFQHFGMTKEFLMFEIENNEIKSAKTVPTVGQGHGELPIFLLTQGVDTVICGGLGTHMVNTIHALGMKLVMGASGSAAACVASYLAGELENDTNAIHAGCSGHHRHEG